METFLCCSCKKLFYSQSSATDCQYCKHVYVIWVTYPLRSKKEVEALLQSAAL